MDDDPAEAFRRALVDAGVVVETGVDGVYGRSSAYEGVVLGLQQLVTRSGVDQNAVAIHFPPVMARHVFERTDYLRSFPDLTGSVHTFVGDDRQHAALLALLDAGEDWSRALEPSEMVLRPAACHPLYPMCAGQLPDGGRRFEVHGWCFRHEPSLDPARMQAFRMHEYVYVGDPGPATSHRDLWVERGSQMLSDLGLEVQVVVASDPFFGRAGKMLASSQREQELKLEIVTPITSENRPTAVMSANCHEDHFGVAFGIYSAKGAVAHSSCIGFGLDRIALALLRTHGVETGRWPSALRDRLWK
jgi:seryl-tRNA synthetase